MSTTAKTGIALVIILVLLVIGWIVVSDKSVDNPADIAVQSASPTPTPTPKLPNTAGTGLSDVSDTSNEALDTDLKAVGTQMDELSNDNTILDKSLKETI